MSHFAQIKNKIVQQVIVADQDFIDILPDKDDWIQTSYNTRGGVYYGPDGGAPLRKNYAGIGYIYDETLDAFYGVQPYPSWILDTNTCLWQAPSPYPGDGNAYTWDEDSKNWKLIENNQGIGSNT
jgi:hypothetical protein